MTSQQAPAVADPHVLLAQEMAALDRSYQPLLTPARRRRLSPFTEEAALSVLTAWTGVKRLQRAAEQAELERCQD